jgi:hypothetical protein
MAKKKTHSLVMPLAMTPDQVRRLQDLRSCNAAMPQASKRDLLGRRNGKIARRERGESLRRDAW